MDREEKRGSLNLSGYSLVELLVSATVMTLTIIAVIAVVRKGRELDSTDFHRRQARAIICDSLESTRYQYMAFTSLSPRTSQSEVIIDNRDGIHQLRGTLRSSIVDDNSQLVPVRKITFSIDWKEHDIRDTITIEKWIAQAR